VCAEGQVNTDDKMSLALSNGHHITAVSDDLAMTFGKHKFAH